MTLEEWVESEYNTGGFVLFDSTVCASSSYIVNVYPIDEVIEAGTEYSVDTSSICQNDADDV